MSFWPQASGVMHPGPVGSLSGSIGGGSVYPGRRIPLPWASASPAGVSEAGGAYPQSSTDGDGTRAPLPLSITHVQEQGAVDLLYNRNGDQQTTYLRELISQLLQHPDEYIRKGSIVFERKRSNDVASLGMSSAPRRGQYGARMNRKRAQSNLEGVVVALRSLESMNELLLERTVSPASGPGANNGVDGRKVYPTPQHVYLEFGDPVGILNNTLSMGTMSGGMSSLDNSDPRPVVHGTVVSLGYTEMKGYFYSPDYSDDTAYLLRTQGVLSKDQIQQCVESTRNLAKVGSVNRLSRMYVVIQHYRPSYSDGTPRKGYPSLSEEDVKKRKDKLFVSVEAYPGQYPWPYDYEVGGRWFKRVVIPFGLIYTNKKAEWIAREVNRSTFVPSYGGERMVEVRVGIDPFAYIPSNEWMINGANWTDWGPDRRGHPAGQPSTAQGGSGAAQGGGQPSAAGGSSTARGGGQPSAAGGSSTARGGGQPSAAGGSSTAQDGAAGISTSSPSIQENKDEDAELEDSVQHRPGTSSKKASSTRSSKKKSFVDDFFADDEDL